MSWFDRAVARAGIELKPREEEPVQANDNSLVQGLLGKLGELGKGWGSNVEDVYNNSPMYADFRGVGEAWDKTDFKDPAGYYDNNTYAGSFGNAAVGNAAGVVGGVADLLGMEKLGNKMNDIVQGTHDPNEVEAGFNLDYITSPHGLARSTGNVIGSMAAIAPFTALVPEAAASTAATKLLQLAGRLGGNKGIQYLIDSGHPQLAKVFAERLGSYLPSGIAWGATSAPIESMAEGGGVVRQAKEAGLDNPYGRGWATAAENLPGLFLSNVGEGMVLRGAFKPAPGASALRRAASVPVTAGVESTQNAGEEAYQQIIQNLNTDRPLSEGVSNAALEGFFGSLLLGGAGGALHAVRNRPEETDTQEFKDWTAGAAANQDYSNIPMPTQGADIDEQVANLKDGWSKVIPQVGGILHDKFGLDGVISSGARSAEHNAEVGGAENSYHIQRADGGDALDIVLPDGTTQEQADAIEQYFKDSGMFEEVLFHDVGSGYHLHLGGLKGGKLPNSTGDMSNFNDKQREAWKEAQWVQSQTGIPAEFIYRQWAHESGNFTSRLAQENNNFGGLTQSEPNGEENKQPDGGNYYRMFDNMHEYAQSYVNDFINRYDGKEKVKTLEDFANFLHDNGYYTDSPENYIAGMRGVEAPSGDVDMEGPITSSTRQEEAKIDTYDDVYEQFAREQMETSTDAEEVDYFSGFFNSKGKFKDTPENRQKLEQDYGEELKQFAEAKAAQAPTPKAQPQETQIESPTENLDKLKANLDKLKAKLGKFKGRAIKRKDFNTATQINKAVQTNDVPAMQNLVNQLEGTQQAPSQNAPQPAQQTEQAQPIQVPTQANEAPQTSTQQTQEELLKRLQELNQQNGNTQNVINEFDDMQRQLEERAGVQTGGTNNGNTQSTQSTQTQPTQSINTTNQNQNAEPGQAQAEEVNQPVQQEAPQPTGKRDNFFPYDMTYRNGKTFPVLSYHGKPTEEVNSLAQKYHGIVSPANDRYDGHISFRNGDGRTAEENRAAFLAEMNGQKANAPIEGTSAPTSTPVQTAPKKKSKALSQYKKNVTKVVSDYRKDKIPYEKAFQKIADMQVAAERVAPDEATVQEIRQVAEDGINQLNAIFAEKQETPSQAAQESAGEQEATAQVEEPTQEEKPAQNEAEPAPNEGGEKSARNATVEENSTVAKEDKKDYSSMSLDELKAERQKQIDDEVQRYKSNPGGQGVNTVYTYDDRGNINGRYGESNNPEWYQKAYKKYGRKPKVSEYPDIALDNLREHQEFDELEQEIARREKESANNAPSNETKQEPSAKNDVKANFSDKSGDSRGGIQSGTMTVWSKELGKKNFNFTVTLDEVDKAMKTSANANYALRELGKKKYREAMERWIEASPNQKVKESRRDSWEGKRGGITDGVVVKGAPTEDRQIESAVRVIEALYEKATGQKPESWLDSGRRKKQEKKEQNKAEPKQEKPTKKQEATKGKAPAKESIFGDEAENEKDLLEALGITEDETEEVSFGNEFGDTTDEEIEALKKELQKELSKLSANPVFNPRIYTLGLQLGGKYIQKGYRTFKKWLEKMTSDLGENIEPWAPAIWETLKTYPKGQKFDPKQIMAFSKLIGSKFERGVTSLEDVNADMKKLLKGRYKEFAPMIEASYNGIEKYFSTIKEGENNVNDSTRGLASRTGEGVNKDSVGRDDESGRPSGGSKREGRQEAEHDVQQQDSAGIYDSSPSRSGKAGNSGVQAEESADRSGGTRDTELSGSVRDSYEGSVALDDGRKAEDINPAEERPVNAAAEKVSKEKANTPYKAGDLDSIKADLPMLRPEQQEDVQRIEKRLFVDKGQGFLCTNGTGTGKTYSGLGVIKRAYDQGKKNILVVAPKAEIIKQWIEAAKTDFSLDIKQLSDTKDNGGEGICITTYANFQANRELAARDWDMIVADESHTLLENKDASETSALKMLRSLTEHPRQLYNRWKLKNRTKKIRALENKLDEYESKLAKLVADHNKHKVSDSVYGERSVSLKNSIKQTENAIAEEYRSMNDQWKEVEKQWKAIPSEDKPKVLFMSATPFAYDKSIDYAEGYLFNYNEDTNPGSYHNQSGFEQFMIQKFGYRFRYGKLAKPEAQVDNRVMEIQFHDDLVDAGVMYGRQIDLPVDYDRGFLLVDGGIGNKIDEGFKFLWDNNKKYGKLADALRKQFDTRAKRYLIESIKAKAVVPIVQEYIKSGKKVVLFHQSMKEKLNVHPFQLKNFSDRQVTEQWELFKKERPDLVGLRFDDIPAPMTTLKSAFKDALYLDGSQEHKKDRNNAVKLFQDDDSGKNLIICQQDAANAGVSLHDTTGKHQRVLINIATPERPIYAMQIEGRIYRVGSVTNAIFRYLSTGTELEKYIFANTIGSRAETSENLALGADARGLQDSFTNLFMETLDDSWERRKPGHPEEGTGGKEMDFSGKSDVTLWERAKSFYYGQQKKTSSTKAREGNDYFATPEPIGLKMVEWLGLKDGDSVLEPSAGHGAISRWFSPNTNNTIVEPSGKLAPLAQMVTPNAKVIRTGFEDFNVVNKFDGIAMNPPFGAGGKTAVDHIAKAFRHLKDGGRLIAILPQGPSADAHFDKWFYGLNKKGEQVEDGVKNGVLTADISLPGVTFNRAGTGVATRIVVIDKHNNEAKQQKAWEKGGQQVDLSNIKDINELFDRMENMTVPERVKRLTAQDKAKSTNGKKYVLPAEGVKGNKTSYMAVVNDAEDVTSDDVKELAKTYRGKYIPETDSFVFDFKEERDDFIRAANDLLAKSKNPPELRDSYPAEIDGTPITIHSDGRITGKTYDIKDTIKENGGKWDRDSSVWRINDPAKLTQFINKYNTEGVQVDEQEEDTSTAFDTFERNGKHIAAFKELQDRETFKSINSLAKDKYNGKYVAGKGFVFDTERDMENFVEEADALLGMGDAKYSKGKEKLRNLLRSMTFPKDSELTSQEQEIVNFGKQLGVKVVWFDGNPNLHGFHQNNITFLNRRSVKDVQTTFYHETFHWLKNNNPAFYQELLASIEKAGVFTQEQLDAYREKTGRYDLSNSDAIEEMLADEFINPASRHEVLGKLAKQNKSIVEKLIAWMKQMVDRIAEVFHNPQGKLTTAQRDAFVKSFNKMAASLRDQNGRQIFTVNRNEITLQNGKPLATQEVPNTSDEVKFSADLGDSEKSFLDKVSDTLAKKMGIKPTSDQIKVDEKAPKDKGFKPVTDYIVSSPSRIAERSKAFKLFYNMADKAMNLLTKNRTEFSRKFDKAWSLCKSQDERNKLNEVLVAGDAEEKEFTKDEITAMGGSENVAEAYKQIRRLIRKAYNLVNEARKRPTPHSRRLTNDEINKLRENPFVEIQKISDAEDGKKLVTYKEYANWTKEYDVTPNELQQFKNDKAIQILEQDENEDGTIHLKVREGISDLANKKGYIPHIFHEYMVRVKNKDGNVVDDYGYGGVLASGRNESEAIAKAEEWLKNNKLKDGETIHVAPKVFSFQSLGMDEGQYAAVMGDKDFDMMVKGIADHNEMTLAEAKEVVKGSAKKKNRHRFFGHTLQRHGANGFEQDMRWALSHYFNSAARYHAMETEFKPQAISLFERLFGDFDKKHTGLAKYVQDYISDINGNPSELEQTINEFLNQSAVWRKLVVSRYGDRAALRAVNSITRTMSYLCLGFLNTSSALLNFSQTINAAAYLGNAKYAPMIVAKGMKRKYSPQEMRVLIETNVGNDIGLDSGSGYDKMRSAGGLLNAIGDKGMILFKKSERACRFGATLVAYNKARAEGKSHDEAIAYAKEINRKSNFDYSVADAPNIFRRGSVISQVALQFKKYGIKEMEVVADMFPTSTKATKSQKAIFWGMYLLTAGLLQVPLFDWWDKLFGGKDKIQKYIMEATGDSPLARQLAITAMYGLAANAGVDMSRRVGLADVIPSEGKNLVPPAINKPISFAQDMAAGNYANAVRDVSPGLYNQYAAWVAGASEGSRGRTNGVYDDMYSKILRAAGFTSTDERIASDIQRITYNQKDEKAKEKQKAIDEFIENPTNENAKRLKELGVKPSTVKKERERKKRSKLDRIKVDMSKEELKRNKDLFRFAE